MQRRASLPLLLGSPSGSYTGSPADAVYASRFALRLHKLDTPSWSSLVYLDRLWGDVCCVVASCTENEAGRYGRFLADTLATIKYWYDNKEAYEKDAARILGSTMAKVMHCSGGVCSVGGGHNHCATTAHRLLCGWVYSGPKRFVQ